MTTNELPNLSLSRWLDVLKSEYLDDYVRSRRLGGQGRHRAGLGAR